MTRGDPFRVADPHRPFHGPPGVKQGDIQLARPCFCPRGQSILQTGVWPLSTRQPRSPEARQRWGDRHGPHFQHLLVGEHSLHTNIFAELLWNSHTVIHTPPHGPINGARSHSGSLPGNGVRVRRADKEFANVPLSILAPLVHIPEVPLIVWRIMSGKF